MNYLTTYVATPSVFIYRLLTHRVSKKLLKYSLAIVFVWFTVHMFNATYAIVNSNGIHGVVAKATLNSIQDNGAKAAAYDSIPTSYLR